jgi:hypothetical protein
LLPVIELSVFILIFGPAPLAGDLSNLKIEEPAESG